MWHKLLGDASLFRVLRGIDDDTTRAARAEGCPHCGGPLDQADYWRKPRGMPAELEEAGYVRRRSLCCRTDGCRRRRSPPLLCFLGRFVFVSVAVVVVSAMLQDEPRVAVREVCAASGAAPQTVRRWLRWWRETFVRSRPWLLLKARIGGGVDETRLPRAALVRFEKASGGDESKAIEDFLRAVIA